MKILKSKIAARVRFVSSILLILFLTVMMAVSVLIINNINNNNARNLVRAYSIEAAQMFLAYISEDLTLVRKASRSRAITAWLIDEENEQKRSAAFDEMIDYTEIVEDILLYTGIEASRNEYSVVKGALFEDFIPIARLDPNNIDDTWYFDSASSENDYTLNIDLDKHTNTWRLWINHKVMIDGNFVGIFCSGMKIPDVFQMIFGYNEDDRVKGYIIDRQGLIQLESNNYGFHIEGTSRSIFEEINDPELSTTLSSYLGRIEGFFSEYLHLNQDSGSQQWLVPEIIRLSRGPYRFVAVDPIGNTDWSVLVFFQPNTLSDAARLLPLLIAMLVVLFLYAISGNFMMEKLIYRPLNLVTQSVSKGRLANTEFYGGDRDDEIGELVRTIKDACNEQQRQKHLLHAANRAAAVLLAAMDDGNIQASFLEGMEIIGRCVNVDRLQIWQNEMFDNDLCFVLKHQWLSDYGRKTAFAPINFRVSYNTTPEWDKRFSRGDYISGPFSGLSAEDQKYLKPFKIKSTVIFPLIVINNFWGFFTIDDCHNERSFTDYELDILRTAVLMIISAMNCSDQAIQLREAHELLNAALNEAKAASHAKTSFLANMSHEMRTPLNAVIGLSELTMEIGDLDEEAQLNLEKISNAGMTLLSTVNDILDISKIEAGKFELIPIDYDTPSLINDAITQSIMRIGEKPIKFILDIEESLPSRLFGDDLRIKQVLNNLLSNAFKYTEEGTVELGVRCNPIDNDQESEGLVQLTAWVKDTGPGIKKEDIDHLFSDYAMLDTKSNRKIEGTGLGLPITKSIAEMMGGSISVESELGKGSIFTVKVIQKFVSDIKIGTEIVNSLRNFRYSDHKRRRQSGIVRPDLSYAKVLVVDDVQTNLDVAKGMMKPYGLNVDCALNGPEAIEIIRNEKVHYNAVFMDHMMPGMDGIEAVKIIREEIDSEYAKTIPIIALTANAIVGNEAMFLNNGFQAFISKPIEIERLDAVIREWVRDKELEKTLGDVKETVERKPDVQAARSGKDRRARNDRRSGWDRRALGKNIDGLDMSKGLEIFGGNEEIYIFILNSYVTNTKPLLELTRAAFWDNISEYAIHVHGIKSSSRAIGADLIGDKAEALENAAKEGNMDFVIENNAQFIKDVETLIKDLEEMNKFLANIKPKKKKASPDPDLLGKLLRACENYDMDGIDGVMEEIEAWDYESDDGLTAWLKDNVERGNFTEIKEKLSALSIK